MQEEEKGKGEGRKKEKKRKEKREKGKKKMYIMNCSQTVISNVSCLYLYHQLGYLITNSFVNFVAMSTMPNSP